MSAGGLVAWNLLANGVGSFALAWVVSRLALKAFRPKPGFALLTLTALPFVKIAFDALRGVPARSFLYWIARGERQDLGAFRVGFGFQWIVPKVEVVLSAVRDHELFPQSGPDLLAAAMRRKVDVHAPLALASLLVAVGVLRLALRFLAFWRADARRRELRARAALVGWRQVGLRKAALWVVPSLEGSPFTGGVLRPYVVFPGPLWRVMTPSERRAALAHELAHVAEHHVLWVSLVGVVRDVFWFVPFIGAAEGRLREACELSADARAVARGTSPLALASSLVRAREALVDAKRTLAPTFGADGASLRARVDRLLEPPPPPRLGFQFQGASIVLTLWVVTTALVSVALGNR